MHGDRGGDEEEGGRVGMEAPGGSAAESLERVHRIRRDVRALRCTASRLVRLVLCKPCMCNCRVGVRSRGAPLVMRTISLKHLMR